MASIVVGGVSDMFGKLFKEYVNLRGYVLTQRAQRGHRGRGGFFVFVFSFVLGKGRGFGLPPGWE